MALRRQVSCARDGTRAGRVQLWEVDQQRLALQRSLEVVWLSDRTHRTDISYFKRKKEMDGSRQEQNCILSFINIMCIVQMFAEWLLLSDPYRPAALGS